MAVQIDIFVTLLSKMGYLFSLLNLKKFSFEILNQNFFSNVCYCGNSTAGISEISLSQCNTQCPNNQNQKCGGSSKIQVYSLCSKLKIKLI